MKLEALELPLNVIDSSFKAGIAGAIAGVTALIGAMGAAVKMTFDWADQLDGLQDVMGVTNEEAAALNFTLRKSGVGAETLSKGMVILEKGLVKADGTLDTTGKALKSWGINVKDVNGKLKGQTALIGDISKKYNSFATQQEKVNFLTEVFGRSGAELIDFFDTLGAEGGIDKVTEKVQRLGLVIDPGRYENFTRSLEELKLVGLGLAVGFTEKVMPALEKFLEIVTGPGTIAEKVGALAGEFDTFVSGAMNNFANSIDTWASGTGPDELADKLISWIDNVGKDDRNKSKIELAAGRIVDAFGRAFEAVDWTAIQASLEARITEMFDASRPRGQDAFADWWDALEVSGTDKVRNFFNNLEVTGTDALRNFMNNLEVSGTDAVRNFFNNWEVSWTNAIRTWGTNVYNSVAGWIAKIKSLLSFLPQLPGVGGASANVSVGSGVNNKRVNGRASGGPTIGGQSYAISEFFQPERFTPAVNGRIDKIQQPQAQQIDEARMATIFGRVLGEQLQKALG